MRESRYSFTRRYDVTKQVFLPSFLRSLAFNSLFLWIVASLMLLAMTGTGLAATTIPFTINMNEAVNVTGTPRIAMDVGGTTRYATYTSGSGTSALTFTYTMTSGDVDLDGVTLSSPIDLNGGSLKDINGNDATLTFTPPNTSNVKVNYPSLGMDFVADADGRYTLNGTAYNDLTSFLTATGGTFSRASIGTYIDSSGILQTTTSGTPRFDYDPVTHAAKGILIEESRTNLLTNSSGATYSGSQISVTANVQSSSIGNLHRYTSTSGTQARIEIGPAVPANTTYTASWWVKKDVTSQYAYIGIYDGNNSWAYINLDTGAVGTGGSGAITNPVAVSYGGGLYRFSATCTRGGTASITGFKFGVAESFITNLDASANVGSSLLGANFQIEQGAFVTSYIPTTIAAVTRQADILNIPTSSWFDASLGTFAAEISPKTSTGTYFVTGAWSNGNNHFLGDAGAFSTTTKLTNSFSLSASGLTSIAKYKNGSTGGLGGYLYGPNYPVSSVYIGSNSNNWLNGSLKKIKYYPLNLPSTQLQLLTQ